MHGGKTVDAAIGAIIGRTDGLHYQIDFGKEQTALISERQIVKEQKRRRLTKRLTVRRGTARMRGQALAT